MTQFQQMAIKQPQARNGVVHPANSAHIEVLPPSGRCQFGHQVGGLTVNSMTAVIAATATLAATENLASFT
jgi:hypothetical protein